MDTDGENLNIPKVPIPKVAYSVCYFQKVVPFLIFRIKNTLPDFRTTNPFYYSE